MPPPVSHRKALHEWQPYLFVVPTLLLVLAFGYLPVMVAFPHRSLTGNGTGHERLVGPEDFPHAFGIVAAAVLGTMVSVALALLAAYFFSRCRMPGSGILWAAFLALMVAPSLANVVPLFPLLVSLKLVNTFWTLMVLAIAGGQLFNVCALRKVIDGIPRDLFAAAEIDGASHLQRLRNVVIPSCGPALGVLTILNLLLAWNLFLLPALVLRGRDSMPPDAETVNGWGSTTVVYLIISLLLIVLFLFLMRRLNSEAVTERKVGG